MTSIAVVGASGRVGSAIVDRLRDRFDVKPVTRDRGDDRGELAELAETAMRGLSVVVNAAGVAHISDSEPATLARLRAGNVELPTELARAALAAGASFLHISSIKAAQPAESPYAGSKLDGELALDHGFGGAFAEAGIAIVVIRPLALLIPPLEAGKIRRLRWLRNVPAPLIPALRLPVLTTRVFLDAVESSVDEMVSGQVAVGFSRHQFARSDRGTLRDVADAFEQSI